MLLTRSNTWQKTVDLQGQWETKIKLLYNYIPWILLAQDNRYLVERNSVVTLKKRILVKFQFYLKSLIFVYWCKWCLSISMLKYSLVAWNSNVTESSILLFAKSGNSTLVLFNAYRTKVYLAWYQKPYPHFLFIAFSWYAFVSFSF